MCAINPKHKKRFIIDVYTSDPELTRREFEEFALNDLCQAEIQLNTNRPHLRFHLKESNEPAD